MVAVRHSEDLKDAREHNEPLVVPVTASECLVSGRAVPVSALCECGATKRIRPEPTGPT